MFFPSIVVLVVETTFSLGTLLGISSDLSLNKFRVCPQKEEYSSKLRDDALEATPTAAAPDPWIIKSINFSRSILKKPSSIMNKSSGSKDVLN
jgi:hypothetical protein